MAQAGGRDTAALRGRYSGLRGCSAAWQLTKTGIEEYWGYRGVKMDQQR